MPDEFMHVFFYQSWLLVNYLWDCRNLICTSLVDVNFIIKTKCMSKLTLIFIDLIKVDPCCFLLNEIFDHVQISLYISHGGDSYACKVFIKLLSRLNWKYWSQLSSVQHHVLMFTHSNHLTIIVIHIWHFGELLWK